MINEVLKDDLIGDTLAVRYYRAHFLLLLSTQTSPNKIKLVHASNALVLLDKLYTCMLSEEEKEKLQPLVHLAEDVRESIGGPRRRPRKNSKQESERAKNGNKNDDDTEDDLESPMIPFEWGVKILDLHEDYLQLHLDELEKIDVEEVIIPSVEDNDTVEISILVAEI